MSDSLPKTKLYLGLDLGGTGVKAGLFDRDGVLVALARRPLTPVCISANQAEIGIGKIEAAARSAVREVTQNGQRRVTALTVASQGQTFVALDAHDRPLHPAILWYDSRAAAQAAAFRRKLAVAASEADAKPFFSDICSGAKILWFKEKRSQVFRRAARYLLLPEYLTYRLTGRAVTDPCTAESTGFYTAGAAAWHTATLQAAGVAAAQLASIQKTATPVGLVAPGMARAWGLAPDTLVVTGTNDQYAGALGAGNCRPGIVTETAGTCLAMVTLVKKLPTAMPAGLYPGLFPLEPYHFVLTFAKTSGLVLDWFRREFGADLSFAQLEKLAASVPVGAGGLTIVPDFDGRVSPVPDSAARGRICGLTLQHGRAEFYRALVEGLSFILKENLDAMRDCGLRLRVIRAIGGGAVSDFWLQMKADVTGLPVERPVVTEAAVSGAALIAAVGAGEFASLAAAATRFCRIGRVFRPLPANRKAYQMAYARYLKAVQA